MRNSVCFIILHYGNNKKLTLDAIKSINHLIFDGKIDVVVVCNGKQFDISSEIKGENVSVVVMDENQGFSVGNNAGYKFALKQDDYDFIICINNDVVIEQSDFIDKLYKNYKETPFYVGGPDIYMPYIDFHSSPLAQEPLDADEIAKVIKKKKSMVDGYKKKLSIIGIKTFILEACIWREKLRPLYKVWRAIKRNNKYYTGISENVVLQGSCIIFSKLFICENDVAFEPEVYLYFEEHYLARKCLERKWRTLYMGDLQVMHYHRGSACLMGRNYRAFCKKKITDISIFIESAEVYKNSLFSKTAIYME